MNTRGRITTIAVVQRHLRHGGQTVGNVQQFATKDVVDPSGERVPVPRISANSIKSLIRRAGAGFALEALGLLSGDELTRSEAYLFYSGGALDSSGQSVRLDRARAAEEYMPILSLCGYSAGNHACESKIRVDDWDLVCWENSERLRRVVDRYAEDHAGLFEAYSDEWIEVQQRTRHDHTRRSSTLKLLKPEEREAVVKQLSSKGSGDKDAFRPMPFEYETLIPGSVLVGGWTFHHGVTERELAAFRSALIWVSEGRADDGGLLIPVGGGGSTAKGMVSLHMHGELAEGVEPTRYVETDELCPPRDVGAPWPDDIQEYIAYLGEHRDEAKVAFGELVA